MENSNHKCGVDNALLKTEQQLHESLLSWIAMIQLPSEQTMENFNALILDHTICIKAFDLGRS